jgi:hypothetical protein
MSVATLSKPPLKKKWKKVRDEWIAEVESMADDIERWAAENDWDTKRESKEIIEDEIGTYQLPVVRVATMQGRIYFDPTARFVCGATGRIDVVATPYFSEARLVKVNDRWRFEEDMKNLRKNWSRKGFTDVVNYLLKKR